MTPMPMTMVDPLEAFRSGAYVAGGRTPVPLVSTTFDVELDGGMSSMRWRSNSDSTEVTVGDVAHLGFFAGANAVSGENETAKARAADTEEREIYIV